MKKFLTMVPIIVVASVIFLTSELLTVPPGTPWQSMYVQLDAIAHVLLYFVLGVFVAHYVAVGLQVRALGILVLTAALCLALGVCDEFHQMYVEGRGAEFRDLFWDLVGAVAGGVLYVALAGLARWIREFLSSAEVNIATMFGRAFAAVTLLVGILVPTVVYAGNIADFVHSVTMQGSSYVLAVIQHYHYSSATGTPTQKALQRIQEELDHKSEPLRPTQASTATARSDKAVAQNDRSGSREALREDMERIKQQLRREILKELKGAIAASPSETAPQAQTSDRRKLPETSRAVRTVTTPSGPEMSTAIAGHTALANTIVQAVNARPKAARNVVRTLTSVGKKSKNRRPYGVGSREPEPCDLVTIITHRSNPIQALSVDQARKIFSGEYVNWREVGGPDLGITVVTVRKRSGNFEKIVMNHMKVSLTPNAVRLPYASFMIPMVAQTKGAIGFLHVQNTEQLDFVVAHEAFKRIAIRNGTESPAVPPSRVVLNTGQYPIMNSRHAALGTKK